jgi:hypothetical protein
MLRPRLAKDVGRIYEDRHSRPELRWFWSISVYVNPMLGITTSGRAQSRDAVRRATGLGSTAGRAMI